MKYFLYLFLLFLSTTAVAQMRVYTVAGSDKPLYEDGPATASFLGATEGVWLDAANNLYICDLVCKIKKVNTTTGVMTTIAGTSTCGYSGDNGLATNAKINGPYGLYVDGPGNVYFADQKNKVVRRVDAGTGIITTIAGGGSDLGDGAPATNANLNYTANVYVDQNNHLYVCENFKIRKVDASTGIITTIAGTGIKGLSGDNGPATNAQLYFPHGIVIDKVGNFYFADRGNGRIRKINTSGIISTVAGTTDGYSGDGGPATAAQLGGVIGLVADSSGNLIFSDNGNDYIRRVNMSTGIITTIAGVGHKTGSNAEGALAIKAQIHPEFLAIDKKSGTIYYSNWGNKIRKIVDYNPSNLNVEQPVELLVNNKIFPNPAGNEITVSNTDGLYTHCQIMNCLGQVVLSANVTGNEATLDITMLPAGNYWVRLTGPEKVTTSCFVKK